MSVGHVTVASCSSSFLVAPPIAFVTRRTRHLRDVPGPSAPTALPSNGPRRRLRSRATTSRTGCSVAALHRVTSTRSPSARVRSARSTLDASRGRPRTSPMTSLAADSRSADHRTGRRRSTGSGTLPLDRRPSACSRLVVVAGAVRDRPVPAPRRSLPRQTHYNIPHRGRLHGRSHSLVVVGLFAVTFGRSMRASTTPTPTRISWSTSPRSSGSGSSTIPSPAPRSSAAPATTSRTRPPADVDGRVRARIARRHPLVLDPRLQFQAGHHPRPRRRRSGRHGRRRPARTRTPGSAPSSAASTTPRCSSSVRVARHPTSSTRGSPSTRQPTDGRPHATTIDATTSTIDRRRPELVEIDDFVGRTPAADSGDTRAATHADAAGSPRPTTRRSASPTSSRR